MIRISQRNYQTCAKPYPLKQPSSSAAAPLQATPRRLRRLARSKTTTWNSFARAWTTCANRALPRAKIALRDQLYARRRKSNPSLFIKSAKGLFKRFFAHAKFRANHLRGRRIVKRKLPTIFLQGFKNFIRQGRDSLITARIQAQINFAP